MGRVEEAMRRAAEQTAGPTPGAALAGPADAETLANAAFPVEGAGVSLPVTVDDGLLGGSGEDPPEAADEIIAAEEVAEEVPHPKTLDAKLVADRSMSPASREQYRRLAATLHQTQAISGLKVVMVVSAMAGEGKTLTASNLALTFSESYKRRVLLIDADLRRPSIHTVFNLQPTPGLSDDLMAAVHRKLPLHKVSERLRVLTAGRPTSDPMAGLTSIRMQRVVQEARDRFDWVVIDTPPVGLLTDASLLAAMADGAVMVVKAGHTPYQAVQRALDALGRDHVLGVVLNRAALNPHHNKYYNYDYYYGRRPDTEQG